MLYVPYSTFLSLYKEALDHNDVELYIAELWYQEWWMKDYTDNQIINVLETTFKIAKMNFAELRKLTGLSVSNLEIKYGISKRTYEKWESKEREPSLYTKVLFSYALFLEMLNEDVKQDAYDRKQKGEKHEKL
ncbi:helix-turn-helix domain-containing protein [Dielma fastidiosa]|uniref:helix-turn-helix domain-containing protein n=1 Tax=Dielma fastidiosa TaxID=1034346 RepID=UPI003567A1EF